MGHGPDLCLRPLKHVLGAFIKGLMEYLVLQTDNTPSFNVGRRLINDGLACKLLWFVSSRVSFVVHVSFEWLFYNKLTNTCLFP